MVSEQNPQLEVNNGANAPFLNNNEINKNSAIYHTYKYRQSYLIFSCIALVFSVFLIPLNLIFIMSLGCLIIGLFFVYFNLIAYTIITNIFLSFMIITTILFLFTHNTSTIEIIIAVSNILIQLYLLNFGYKFVFYALKLTSEEYKKLYESQYIPRDFIVYYY